MPDIVTIKEHFKALLAERDKALDAALVSVNDRLKLLNELREGVATKEQLEAVEKLVYAVSSRLDRIEGKSTGLNAGWAYLIGIVGLAGAVVGLILAFNN